MMLGGNGNLATNPLINKKLGYDPLRDLAPVTSAALGGHILVVHPSLPVYSLREFIALAKSRPGQLNYGSAGVGSSQHLTAELLQRMTKVVLLHVPYRVGPPATADLVAGQTQFALASTSTVVSFVSQGRLRPIAVTTKRRLALIPQVPTLAGAGVAEFEAYTWYGFVVPAKTPQVVIAKLSKEIVQILNLPESVEFQRRHGMEAWTGAPEAFGAHMKSEQEKWGRIIAKAGIKE